MSAESTSAEIAEQDMEEKAEKIQAADESESQEAEASEGSTATSEAEPEALTTSEGDAAKPQAGPQVEKIRAAMQSGSSVNGTVIGWNDGGMHVVVNGVTAFCPHSEMELGEALEPMQYVDKSYDFFVLRIENEGRRIVLLSRVSHLRQEQKAQQAETRGRIEVGAVLSGKVVSIKDFGAFVDLGAFKASCTSRSSLAGASLAPRTSCSRGTMSRSRCSRSTREAAGSRSRCARSSPIRGRTSRPSSASEPR